MIAVDKCNRWNYIYQLSLILFCMILILNTALLYTDGTSMTPKATCEKVDFYDLKILDKCPGNSDIEYIIEFR